MAMPSTSSLVLVAALAGAAVFALVRKEPVRPMSTFESKPTQNEPFDPSMDNADDDELPPNHPPIGGGNDDVLPPNHPPIDGKDTPGALGGPADDGTQAISWKDPAGWLKVANTNSMRLATYRVPAAAGARDEAELTVVRAGGSPEANIERWIGQFENAEGVVRDKRVVHGLTVSTLEVRGSFSAGAMAATGPAESKSGWMLKGAVVETAQGLYFFKLTGPTPSVVAARPGFDAIVNSVTPIGKAAAQ
jgi:hypothetical protein